MHHLIYSGKVPSNIKVKATTLIESSTVIFDSGWKKIRGLHEYYSFRLSRNYRALGKVNSPILVCNHDVYEKKMKTLKKGGN